MGISLYRLGKHCSFAETDKGYGPKSSRWLLEETFNHVSFTAVDEVPP